MIAHKDHNRPADPAAEKISLSGYSAGHDGPKEPHSVSRLLIIIVAVVAFLGVVFALTRGGGNNTSTSNTIEQDGPSGDQLDAFDIQ